MKLLITVFEKTDGSWMPLSPIQEQRSNVYNALRFIQKIVNNRRVYHGKFEINNDKICSKTETLRCSKFIQMSGKYQLNIFDTNCMYKAIVTSV